jgi:hypothetical protein
MFYYTSTVLTDGILLAYANGDGSYRLTKLNGQERHARLYCVKTKLFETLEEAKADANKQVATKLRSAQKQVARFQALTF